MNRYYGVSLITLMFGMLGEGGAAAAAADQNASPGNTVMTSDITEVIVTGTRESQVQASHSLSPIDIVPSRAIFESGATNVSDALERVLPSVNQPGFGGDHSALIKAIRLRGLNADQVLILVNGKRRHASALLNLDPGPVAGSDPVDLNLIPTSAIDHIEVLEDGAAAQYGSDAIGGVINIILKDSAEGGSITATGGAYYKGDGIQVGGTVDQGFQLGAHGFLHLSASAVNNEATNRSGPNLQIISGNQYVNKLLGSPANNLESLGFNAGETLVNGIQIYGFGTVAHRWAASFETYHGTDANPSNNGGVANDPPLYPNGYVPRETLDEIDFSLTAGAKGANFAGWAWDLSSTYGRDFDNSGLSDSLNQSLGVASPTTFHIGNSIASQWTNNLDLKRTFKLGVLPAPLMIAVGAEHRYEDYQIQAGDPASYIQGTANPTGRPGSIGDFGFEPSVTVSPHRNSESVYAEFSTSLTSSWRVDVAGRYEHYSDFGDAETGKFATRYDFNPRLAARATIQTAFRAPSLAQEDYALTQTASAIYPGGPHLVVTQLPVESPQAIALGSTPLKPEKSVNYSAGIVAEPISGLRLVIDAYEIDIRDRITNSADMLTGLNAAGTEYDIAAYFTNGLDTRSRGLEGKVNYTTNFDERGSVHWSLNASYNRTTITRMSPTPAVLAARGLSLFSPVVLGNITTADPNTKIIGGAEYTIGRWRAVLHETYLGSASDYVTIDAVHYSLEQFRPHLLTDLAISYELNSSLSLTAGANNLFNAYPNHINPADEGTATGTVYPAWSPISINGGFYYTRLAFTF